MQAVERARRHQRAFARLAFALLALIAELVGRALTHRLDFGRHVAAPSYAGTDYYPFLVAAVKIGVALLLARLAWRFVKARAASRAATRVLEALRASPRSPAPRVRLELSPRLWGFAFVSTSVIYLVQTDAERYADGGSSLFTPWIHTSALPIFAVLSVAIAVLYRSVARWLAEYESYAEATLAHASQLAAAEALVQAPRSGASSAPPRRLFGLAFESRPPPALA